MLSEGEILYKKECVLCHGQYGDAGKAASANLTTSLLSLSQIKVTVREGRGKMPPFDYLTKSEVKALANYTKSLQIDGRE